MPRRTVRSPYSSSKPLRNPTWRPSGILRAPGALLVLTSALSHGSATFVDVADEAGLTDVFHCGRDDQKDHIIETLGGGVALLDYDRDGFLDAFFVTGSTLEGFPPGKHPSNQL